MKPLESIIQDFEAGKEFGLNHRRPFLNLRIQILQLDRISTKFHT